MEVMKIFYWFLMDQVTILKEYCWGPDAVLYSLPTGSFDPNKHQTYEDCAYAELSEEVMLSKRIFDDVAPTCVL